ncbi:MAG: lysophospholipid acyltransferase family protein [Bacteroidales bacterium]|nr:lysophospholipid acyltransferase family protein [Bacteroidales bacterium]
MLKTISWFTYLWWSMLIPRFKLIKLNRQGKIAERDACAHAIARKWAQSGLRMNGSSINAVGLENVPLTGGVLFVANHQSNFDIPILVGHIPRDKGFIAKLELLKVPTFSRWMKYIGCIFIDRKDPRQSLSAINEVAERLKAGHSIVIFPEGTRSADGTIAPFKAGGLRLGIKAGVPIVPVTISGSMNIMPKGTSIIRSAKVKVIVSPPLLWEDYKGMDSNQISEKVRNIIISNLETSHVI